MTVSAHSNPRSGIGRLALAAAAPAPAALLTTWAFILVVLLSNPIRPYTDGAWAPGDLLALGLAGALIGVVSRPVAAVIGTALGISAAVVIQLFVLAGQAVYQPVVVSGLREGSWTAGVAGALLLAAGAIALGYAIVRTAVLVRERNRRAAVPPTHPAPAAAALLVTSLVVVVLVGASLLSTARSAYVAPANEPTIHVGLLADGTIITDSPSVPAGRTTILLVGQASEGATALSLIGPLSASQLAAIDRKVLPIDTSCCYWNSNVARTELPSAGTYAFVAEVHTEPPVDQAEFEAWMSSRPISAARTLTVTAGPARTAQPTEAGGDGGRYLTLPVLAGLGIEGWAAAGALLRAIRRSRPLTAGLVVGAVLLGVGTAVGLAVLAMLAISQAHSPF